MKTNLKIFASGAVALFGAVAPVFAQLPSPAPTPQSLFGVTFSNQLITVDPATGKGTLVGSLGSIANAYGIAARSGKLYIFDQMTDKVREINPTSGKITRDINIGVTGLVGEGDIAFRSDGTGFLASALDGKSSAFTTVNDFYTFDVDAGTSTRLGSTGVTINAMAFDSNGTLYAIGEGDVNDTTAPFGAASLYTINIANGATTKVGELSVKPGSPIGAMAFAPIGTLFASIDDRLYTIDKTSGAATPVSTTVLDFDFSSVSGLTFAPGAASLGNISTRAAVGTGDNVEIAGFIVKGTPSKKVLLRGIGPSLPEIGVLADPVLELFNSQRQSLVRNDNWKDSAQVAEITATGIAPTNDKESAILQTLAAGAYTAILSGAKNTTGVGLAEVYDLDLGVGSTLANISTRANVQTGNNVLIGGIFVSGSAPQRVAVRAIGPDLTASGVPNALQDPNLEIHDSNGAIIGMNDDYLSGGQAVELTANELTPGDRRDSAIILDLAPSRYTAIVDGKGGTGVGLVEIYNLTSGPVGILPQ